MFIVCYEEFQGYIVGEGLVLFYDVSFFFCVQVYGLFVDWKYMGDEGVVWFFY